MKSFYEHLVLKESNQNIRSLIHDCEIKYLKDDDSMLLKDEYVENGYNKLYDLLESTADIHEMFDLSNIVVYFDDKIDYGNGEVVFYDGIRNEVGETELKDGKCFYFFKRIYCAIEYTRTTATAYVNVFFAEKVLGEQNRSYRDKEEDALIRAAATGDKLSCMALADWYEEKGYIHRAKQLREIGFYWFAWNNKEEWRHERWLYQQLREIMRENPKSLWHGWRSEQNSAE